MRRTLPTTVQASFPITFSQEAKLLHSIFPWLVSLSSSQQSRARHSDDLTLTAYTDEEATQDFSAAQQSSVGEITVVVEKLQTMEPGQIVPSPDWLSKGFYKEPEYSMNEHNHL